ncbi:type II secretion system protein J [Deinococcus sp.]|uniref:PulJ/GspJ family protein n=1 Tax=Deinococcus sp. TaxID=47478 RepID=UPI0025C5BAA0|nr:prepilin-type N-terminal cleavage/methylation domain-containing protein [Deinococcus sp.]
MSYNYHKNKSLIDREAGFTIIEVLVALLLFAIIIVVLVPIMIGSLKMNRQTGQQLDTSTRTQQLLETVRGEWADRVKYDKACAATLSVPAGYSVTSQPLDSRAAIVGGSTATNITTTCPATIPPSPPAMRRVTVTSGAGPQDTRLTLDLLRPQ